MTDPWPYIVGFFVGAFLMTAIIKFLIKDTRQ
jgi:hypothetical protein